MEALVTATELAERLPFVMDADELREAEGALDDLSDDARLYGTPRWTDPSTVSRQAKNLILRAAARHMKNYEGYTTSRAGDETVMWTDRGEQSGTAYFTEREIKALRALGGNRASQIYSVNTFAYTDKAASTSGYVPDEASNEPILFFSSGTDPW